MDGPLARIPLTLRRRVHWGDSDTAQIAYTSKFVDFAIEAAEYWWESVLGIDWYQLNVEQKIGTPMVGLKFDFESALISGDRLDLTVLMQRLGRSSLTLRVEGHKVGGIRSFTAELTSALVDREAMRATPFPNDWRQRIEGYGRECELAAKGVKSVDDVIDFWFGAPGSDERGTARLRWFGKDPSIDPVTYDQTIRETFLATYEAINDGSLEHWLASPDGALALILVLDQFSRHMFRGEPQAFATDGKALAAACIALDRGFDQAIDAFALKFFYLPFEHSEDLVDQERCIQLFQAFAGTEEGDRSIEYAKRHYDIVARFGRFPHRNEALSRDSTKAELTFLKEPGSSF